MLNVAHVLCPTDLSASSGRAFEYALALARWFEARLTALHVVPTPPTMLGTLVGVAPPSDASGLGQKLERFVHEHHADGVPVETALATGDPARVIAAQAAESGADLVVAGYRGRRGLARWILGSVAERLLHTSPAPLLVVPARADDTPRPVPTLLKRLLCAVDFSDGSLRAVEFAFALAQEADARVRLVHVVEAVPLPTAAPAPLMPVGPLVAESLAEVESEAHDRLERVIPHGARDWCEPQARVVRGTPWREIVREASDASPGLIVVGAGRHGRLDRLLFGSTAEAVVRHAPCPVVVVPLRHSPGETA